MSGVASTIIIVSAFIALHSSTPKYKNKKVVVIKE
jgi:hypothetical protein